MKLYRYSSHVLLCLLLAGIITSCKQNPKELGTVPVKVNSEIADDHKNIVMDVHQIRIQEAYPSSKYLYLLVQEGNRSYWVATAPTEVEIGDIYYYNEALVKADFESKEMGKVFDTIYLVTKLVSESHAAGLKPTDKIAPPPKLDESASKVDDFHSKMDDSHTNGMYREATAVSIGELLANPGKLEGKMVEIKGLCTKINTGILGRNWIHVQDSDDSDKKIVVTSQWEASPGDEITVRALVALNKDFGAGYTYDVLLEKGILMK